MEVADDRLYVDAVLDVNCASGPAFVVEPGRRK
jgi:hypothetical protein